MKPSSSPHCSCNPDLTGNGSSCLSGDALWNTLVTSLKPRLDGSFPFLHSTLTSSPGLHWLYSPPEVVHTSLPMLPLLRQPLGENKILMAIRSEDLYLRNQKSREWINGWKISFSPYILLSNNNNKKILIRERERETKNLTLGKLWVHYMLLPSTTRSEAKKKWHTIFLKFSGKTAVKIVKEYAGVRKRKCLNGTQAQIKAHVVL